MNSDRPYRKALPRERAIEEIKRGAGTQFDPRVVKAFLRLEERPQPASARGAPPQRATGTRGARSHLPHLVLYIVPTPLGNLQDITLRALDTLKNADIIYCEDTRRTRRLLSAFHIHKPLERYLEHNPRSVQRLFDSLKRDKHVVLVSDGGTPAVSDPGYKIVDLARREGLEVTSLPGCSAVTTMAAGCGFPVDSFVFLGFLPRSPGKQKKLLVEAAGLQRTILLFESPFRIVKTLDTCAEALGPHTQAALGRELTKIHEEWLRGSLSNIRQELSSRKEILGEMTLAINPRKAAG